MRPLRQLLALSHILAGLLTSVAPALAQDSLSPDTTSAHEFARLSARDVVQRIDTFDPLVRQRVAERVRTEVALRRAQWDRVRATAGAYAGHAVGLSPLGATDSRMGDTRTSDRFAGLALIDIRVPLYAGGAVEGSINAADARVTASHYATEYTRQELKRAALVAYAGVIATANQVEVATHAGERAEALLRITTTRKNTGIGTDADVARSRLFLLNRQEEVAARQADADAALAVLRAALIIDSTNPLSPADSLETLSIMSGHGPVVYPELQTLIAQARASEADVTVARAGYLPSIEVFAQGQYGNGSMGGSPAGLGLSPVVGPRDDRFGSFFGAASAGAVVSWKAFDMFITRDKIAHAQANTEVIKAQIADVERNLRGLRERATANEGNASRRVQILNGGKETAADAVRLARARYETGNAILTEVLDAELEGIGIVSRQVQAAYDLAAFHVERLRAEGLRL